MFVVVHLVAFFGAYNDAVVCAHHPPVYSTWFTRDPVARSRVLVFCTRSHCFT
jgi:hypothetical protein